MREKIKKIEIPKETKSTKNELRSILLKFLDDYE